jgi:hypothetical protein
MLKTQKSEFEVKAEDLNGAHQEELLRLSYQLHEKDALLEELHPLTQRLRDAQRVNGELEIRIKSMSSEIDDLK